MRETALFVFAVMAVLRATTPTTADRAEPGLRRGLAISGDLICSAPARPDPGPAIRRDVDEFLEREKNEDDPEGPPGRSIAVDRFRGLIPVPRPSSHAPRDHASALHPTCLAAPLRC